MSSLIQTEETVLEEDGTRRRSMNVDVPILNKGLHRLEIRQPDVFLFKRVQKGNKMTNHYNYDQYPNLWARSVFAMPCTEIGR